MPASVIQRHIKGLDGLRFLGMFTVLLYHIEGLKSKFGVPSLTHAYHKTQFGNMYMTMFFVISGFLITYILLNEKIKTGTINLKKFYINRLCRIGPVYYVTMASAYFLCLCCKWLYFPPEYAPYFTNDFYWVLLINILPLTNLHLFFKTRMRLLGHTWSLGTEEQFYAMWPLIIKKSTRYLREFMIVILVKMTVKIILALLYRHAPLPLAQLALIKKLEMFLYIFRIEALGTGGVAALLFIENRTRILDLVYNRWTQVINLAVLCIFIFIPYKGETIHLLYSVQFAIIILNMAGNPKPVFSLDNKITDYLGKVSYSVYMYQIPLLVILLNIFRPYYAEAHGTLWNIAFYAAALIIILGTAVLSYELMEKKIIAWGRRRLQAEKPAEKDLTNT